jgi:integrase/recombinase XerD
MLQKMNTDFLNHYQLEELEMLRKSCDTVRQRTSLEVLYATGCRLPEVHGLDKADINLQYMSTLVIGKGDKQREVYFSIRAMYHLTIVKH